MNVSHSAVGWLELQEQTAGNAIELMVFFEISLMYNLAAKSQKR